MTELILPYHGQSLWNAENKFMRWMDVPLSEMEQTEATIASCKLRGYWELLFPWCMTLMPLVR